MTRLVRLVLALLLAASPALAQQRCGPRDAVVDDLRWSRGMDLVAGGLRGPDVMVELWVTPDGSLWAVTQRHASGVTCVVYSGVAWMQVIPKPAGEPG